MPIRDRLAPFSRTGPAPVGRITCPSAIPQTQRERFHDATDTGPLHGPTGTAGVSPAPSARRSYPSSYPDSTGHDDRYHYDGLYQVTRREQGSLTLDQTAVCGVPAEAEAFAYDPTGNCRTASRYDLERGSASLHPPLSASAPFQWLGYRKDEAGATVLDQERKNNRDNQIVQFDGSGAGVSYDKAGNALRMPPTRLGDWAQHYRLTWDAWNRLVRVQTDDEFAPPVAEYAYDGAFRRITVSNGILTIGTYYNDLWRPVEERLEGQSDPLRQYVWGARPGHRDELILRDRDTGGGSLDERLYCLMDYFDPTAVIDPSGGVVERYGWSAFGQRRVMDADWAPRSSSAYAFDFGFHGQFLDSDTGYYNYGYRYYSPQIGRWLSKDPIGESGGANLSSYSNNNSKNTAVPQQGRD
ncbi:MAG: hypothetical protein JNK37_16595 [Verrucomicrobiales bacterium]|nr:hypothetical protein [Verrucomicrobiales bacterium]